MSKYQYTDDMKEISGFGGEYEEACRKMVVAGAEWFDEHPTAEPKFKGYKNVFGIIMEDNEDARALSDAVVKPSDDCTGAMHQAAIGHVLYIHKHGWEKYVEKMKQSKTEKENV
jgi:hypothetical protein